MATPDMDKIRPTIEAQAKLQEVLDKTGGTIRHSVRGVPHLVVSVGSACVSVCWFKRLQAWKTFYPWPGDAQIVQTWVREELETMVDYIEKTKATLMAHERSFHDGGG